MDTLPFVRPVVPVVPVAAVVVGFKSSPTVEGSNWFDVERPGERLLVGKSVTETPSTLIDVDVGSSFKVSSAGCRLCEPARSPVPIIDGSSMDVGSVLFV